MPPTPLVLRKGQLVKWGDVLVTEHNRSELDVNPNSYENLQRMWDGSGRKYFISDKLVFSLSWDDLPSEDAWTVDGKAGAKSLRAFWRANKGSFPMVVTNGDGSIETYQVMITDFSWKLKKRAQAYDMWDVTVELEEV